MTDIVKQSARALLFDGQGSLVFFKRTKPGQEPYWSTVGGKVEPEDADTGAALHREVFEEIGGHIDRVRQVLLITDDHLVTGGCWQAPPNATAWQVPRDEVDDMVDHLHSRFEIVAFFADPGAGDDDALGGRFWDRYIDGWADRYGSQYEAWAVPRGDRAHAVMWDMTSPKHTQEFTAEVGRTLTAIEDGDLTHDGDPRLRTHVLNARRRPNKHGVSIGKEHRESSKKIDLAVCAIGARLVARKVKQGENRPSGRRKRPSTSMAGV